LRFVEIGRRTAAPVQLTNLAAGKKRRAVNNFLLKEKSIRVKSNWMYWIIYDLQGSTV
jgi:hypothetical protein